MIHLVCYSAQAKSLEKFQTLFPPTLNIRFFNDWPEMEGFINTLKIPTQVVIDLQAHPKIDLLPLFFKKNQIHHMICVTPSFEYATWIEYMGYGAALVSFLQLQSLSWWWNRTSIQTVRAEVEKALTGIQPIALMSSPHLLQKTHWPTVLTAKKFRPVHTMSCQEINLHQNPEAWCKDHQGGLLICTDFDQVSPHYFREHLKNWIVVARNHQLLICIDLKSSQVDFEAL
ncbi:MAG: hypothetical protein FJ161_03580, partial [Gammaproteobacteria bacterium]|nr:hypothetical protein [Gammaproteobacteria bacterium]